MTAPQRPVMGHSTHTNKPLVSLRTSLGAFIFRQRSMSMPPATASITLHYALLGLLARRPLTGYEILKRFTRSVVFFWNAKRSQIYAELKRMERLGFVASRGPPHPG